MNIEVSSVTFNGATYNATTGKPSRIDGESLDELVKGRPPGAKYATEVFNVQGDAEMTVWMHELVSIVKGTESNLAAVLRGKTGTPTVTFANMRYRGIRVGQDKDQIGVYGYVFGHGANADGNTDPVSIT